MESDDGRLLPHHGADVLERLPRQRQVDRHLAPRSGHEGPGHATRITQTSALSGSLVDTYPYFAATAASTPSTYIRTPGLSGSTPAFLSRTIERLWARSARTAKFSGLDGGIFGAGGGHPARAAGALLVEKRGAAVNRRQVSIIVALGTTQTLAWASSYYLPAILADPIARDLGVSPNWIFAAFSASLVISAILGPRIGRQIDLVGGRSVLSLSNLVLAAGLALLGLAYSIPVMLVAWLLLGIGMGAGLYDAPSAPSAASMVTRRDARSPASP